MHKLLLSLLILYSLNNCKATDVYTKSGNEDYYEKNIRINNDGSLQLSDELRDILKQNTKLVEHHLNSKNVVTKTKKCQIIKLTNKTN